jgi:hypothetical protein
LEEGWELSLLVRRGVVAWMRAWPTAEEPQSPRPHVDDHANDSSAAQITIPSALRQQVTSLLVNMILPQRSVQLNSIP